MPFPTIDDVNNSDVNSQTNHIVDLPSGIASGHLLLAFFAVTGDSAITWPTGWTELFEVSAEFTTQYGIGFRRADGGEGSTITVVTASSGNSAHATCRISGHHTTSDPEVSSGATGDNANPNPDSVSPSWGAEENLYMANWGTQDGRNTVSVWPTNYGLSQTVSQGGGSSGSSVAFAGRNLNAASDDPSVATVAFSSVWGATAIVIRPAPDVGGPLAGLRTLALTGVGV